MKNILPHWRAKSKSSYLLAVLVWRSIAHFWCINWLFIITKNSGPVYGGPVAYCFVKGYSLWGGVCMCEKNRSQFHCQSVLWTLSKCLMTFLCLVVYIHCWGSKGGLSLWCLPPSGISGLSFWFHLSICSLVILPSLMGQTTPSIDGNPSDRFWIFTSLPSFENLGQKKV